MSPLWLTHVSVQLQIHTQEQKQQPKHDLRGETCDSGVVREGGCAGS